MPNNLLNSIKEYKTQLLDSIKESKEKESKEIQTSRKPSEKRKDKVKPSKIVKDKVMSELVKYTPNYNLIKEYLDDLENSLKNSNMCYISLKFKTLQKFIAGWSLLYFITEVPLAWDLILDTPYIPGSEIKGILKDYFKEFTNNTKATDCIFGNKGVGKVIFFDAYPIEGPQNNSPTESNQNILTYDIISPHYNGARNEYEVQPVPIKFLAINKGVTFKTFLAFNKDDIEKCKVNQDESVEKTLLKALVLSMKMGWGRRTSRGYGNLKLLEVH